MMLSSIWMAQSSLSLAFHGGRNEWHEHAGSDEAYRDCLLHASSGFGSPGGEVSHRILADLRGNRRCDCHVDRRDERFGVFDTAVRGKVGRAVRRRLREVFEGVEAGCGCKCSVVRIQGERKFLRDRSGYCLHHAVLHHIPMCLWVAKML
jgi:hypothetical protein